MILFLLIFLSLLGIAVGGYLFAFSKHWINMLIGAVIMAASLTYYIHLMRVN